MDNVTHSLVGVLLCRAGLSRLGPGMLPLVVVAANAPDLDIVTAVQGQVAYLHHHRGWSHSILIVPLIALALLPLWYLLVRKHKPGLRQWAAAYLAALIGAFSHPLLDLLNVYGIRFLMPFRADWQRLDIVHIIDIWIWALLLVAVLAPLLSRLVSSEIGAKSGPGRGGAITALVLLAAFLGLRFQLHANAIEMLNSRLYGGETPKRVEAMPTSASPWQWHGVVETATAWRAVDVNLLREFDPDAARVFYKPNDLERFRALRQTATGRVFLNFSQLPMWRVVPVANPSGGLRVSIHDLRFGPPEDGMFTASFVFDAGYRVVEESFTMGVKGRGD